MNKKIQLSIAALALFNGLFLSAQTDLESTLKNVKLSGVAAARYNDYKDSNTEDLYKIAINAKSAITDDITFNTRIIAANTGLTNSKPTSTGEADDNLDAIVSELNFSYSGVDNLKVTMGKQGIVSPWTVARADLGKEQVGTGITASYDLGSTNLVASYFNKTNFDKESYNPTLLNDDGSNFALIGAKTKFANTSVEAYYSTMQDSFDSYTLAASTSFDIGEVNLKPFTRYTALTVDKLSKFYADSKNDDQELWQVGLTARLGNFKAFAAYGESGKEGGAVYVDITSKVGMDYHWRVTANKDANSKYTYLHTTVDVTPKVIAGVFYSKAEKEAANSDVSEIYGQVVYKVSKNLLAYARYGTLDNEAIQNDGSMGRLHIKYSF